MPDDSNADERAFWSGRAGETWVSHQAMLEAMHGPFIPPVLAAAELKPGMRVLDVGCGTGASSLAAAEIAGPAGRVTGLDISATMLAGAAARPAPEMAAPVEWLEADAQNYDFGPAAYDAIVSRMGVMFFNDPVAAFANLGRAATAGARFAAICWRRGDEAPWFSIGRHAIEDVLGPLPPVDPTAPGPMAFADEDRVIGILEAAGWHQAACEKRPITLRPGLGLDAAHAMAQRLGPVSRALSNPDLVDRRDDLAAALRERLRTFMEDGQLVLPVVMNLFTARAPA